MNLKRSLKKRNKLKLKRKKFKISPKSGEIIHKPQKIMIIFILSFFLFYSFNYQMKIKNSTLDKSTLNNSSLIKPEAKIYFDQYEVSKYNEIKDKLISSDCSQMWDNQREFLNGLVRKFRPKKILEIGVYRGGSSIVLLNAIEDFKDSHLYSIDLDSRQEVGDCVNKYFPNLSKKWTLFKGKIATEYLEEIGDNIDMVLIDTAHFEPGEIMDFLMVLPFLKVNAIVAFHDIANQITSSQKRDEWAPYIIFNGIRGEKYLPSGEDILKQNIGAAILDTNQKKYYQEYFRLLGGQWQYFPEEEHVIQLRKFFKKYYEKDCKECLIIFEEAISFNRDFVKRNPKEIFYRYTSD